MKTQSNRRRSLSLLALMLACLVAFTLPVNALAAPNVTANEQTLFSLLNEDRARYGLNALTLDAELCALARLKSQDMVDNNYFAHLSPTYGTVRTMLTQFGVYYLAAGENIARSRSVFHSNAAFLSSEGHRRTMLSKNWTHVGIGVVENQYGFVTVTEIFVRK